MYTVVVGAGGEYFDGPAVKTFNRAKKIAEAYMAEPAKHDCETTSHVLIRTPDGREINAPFVI